MSNTQDENEIESQLVEDILQEFEKIGIDTSEWEYKFGDGNFAHEFIAAGIKSHLEKLSQPAQEAPQGQEWKERFMSFYFQGDNRHNPHEIIEWIEQNLLPSQVSHPSSQEPSQQVDVSATPLEENGWKAGKLEEFNEECLLITATYFEKRNEWDCNLWLIKKVDGPNGWYWGLCEQDGEEWGDYSDLKADLYKVLQLPAAPNH